MVSGVADERLRWGPSATAVNLLQLTTLGGAALLTWLQVDPFGHPALLPTAATLVGGSSIWKAAIDSIAARHVTVAMPVTLAVTAALALGEFSTALIMTMLVRFTSIVETWSAGVAERGSLSRAPIENTADRLSTFLVYGGLVSAAATLLATRNARAALSVLIVVACGVGASTQVAVLTAIARSRVQGVIVKGGAILEALWACDSVVLGSTAAMVLDEPVVRAVYPAAGVSVRDVLTAAAIAERPSDHPIGRAIVRSATEKRLTVREPDRFSSVQGRGITALCDGEEILVGNTAFVTQGRLPDVSGDAPSSTVFVMRGGRYLGAISLARQTRPDAKRAITGLKSMAIRTYLLTGESRIATEPIAGELMVDDFEPDLGPGKRLQRLQDLAKKRRVVMLGDAVEDASALEAAAAGMTIGSATAVGDPHADIVLVSDDVTLFVEVVRLARRTHRVILENITGTMLVDAAGVALAAAGMLSPFAAVLVRAGAELALVLNSARVGLRVPDGTRVAAPVS